MLARIVATRKGPAPKMSGFRARSQYVSTADVAAAIAARGQPSNYMQAPARTPYANAPAGAAGGTQYANAPSTQYANAPGGTQYANAPAGAYVASPAQTPYANSPSSSPYGAAVMPQTQYANARLPANAPGASQYGNFAPVYGNFQAASQYGNFAPVYGNFAPVYGNFAPVYGNFAASNAYGNFKTPYVNSRGIIE